MPTDVSKKLPSVKSELPRDLRIWMDRVREVIGQSASLQDVTNVVTTSVGGGTPGGGDPGVDPPTIPVGLTATGGIDYIFVEWDWPAFDGYAYTEIWAATSDVFGNKVLIGQSAGSTFAHYVGSSETRCYWIRHVNALNVVSDFNGVTGTCATTTIDPGDVLPILIGELDESYLTEALNDRLDLIDDPSTGLVEQVTHLQSTVGIGGNLVPDSRFTTVPRPLADNPASWKTYTDGSYTFEAYKTGENAYALATDAVEQTYAIISPNPQGSVAKEGKIGSGFIPVEPSTRYCFSVYIKGQYGQFRGRVEEFNSAGTQVSTRTTASVSKVPTGTGIDSFTRAHVFFTTTATTAKVRVGVRNYVDAAYSGQQAILYAIRPMLEEATADQTSPSAWQPGGEPALFAALEERGMVYTDGEGEGTAQAVYTLKLRAGDETGEAQVGFGMAVVKENGNWVSDVRFSATRFAIMGEGGTQVGDNPYPFIVYGSQRVVDGETFPAGVYLKKAFIDEASISNAMIKNATITDAKIVDLSANKLTSDYIENGVSIYSSNWITNNKGWILNGNGDATFGTASGSRIQFTNGTLYVYDSKNNNILTSGEVAQFNTNYLKNAWLENDTDWAFYDSHGSRFGYDFQSYNASTQPNVLLAPDPNKTLRLYGTIGTANYYPYYCQLRQIVPVKEGLRYQFYALGAAFQCTARIFLAWYNSSGGFISNSASANCISSEGIWGGPDTADFKFLAISATAPTGAVNAHVVLRLVAENQTVSTVRAHFTRPYFGLAGPNDSYTKWTASHVPFYMDAGNISTYIDNAAIDTALIRDLSVTTGKIGDLQVTDGKIANATITNAKIVNLNGDKITAGSIYADRLVAEGVFKVGSFSTLTDTTLQSTIDGGTWITLTGGSTTVDFNHYAPSGSLNTRRIMWGGYLNVEAQPQNNPASYSSRTAQFWVRIMIGSHSHFYREVTHSISSFLTSSGVWGWDRLRAPVPFSDTIGTNLGGTLTVQIQLYLPPSGNITWVRVNDFYLTWALSHV